MRLNFTAKTNKDYVMINTAIFILPNGTTLEVDRKTTEYSIEDGNLDMVWKNCYLWSINGCYIFGDTITYIEDEDYFKSLIENADLKLDIECDADEDYEITDVAYTIS